MKQYIVLLLSLVLLAFTLQAQEEKKDGVPVDILLKEPTQSNFSISPDGRYFAEILKVNKRNELIIIDIDGYKLYSRIELENKSIQGLYWLTEKRLMFESLGEIFAIDIDGNNSTTIVNRMPDKVVTDWYRLYKNFRYNNILNFLRDRRDEILIETYDYKGYASVKRVNIFTSESYLVLSGLRHKMNQWITDSSGKVRLGVRYDEEGVNYFELGSNSDEWVPLNIRLDNQNYPLKISASSYLNQNMSFEGFGYEEDIIYLSSNINSDKRNLIKYDLKNKKVVEVILEDMNCDISDPHGEDVQLIFDSKNRVLAGARYEGLTPKFKWFSNEYKGIHEHLNKKYNGMVHDLIDVDSDNSRFVVYQWSDHYAGNIGIYTVKDSSYAVMHQINEELNDYKLSKTKNIVIPARDGYRVPAYINLPPDYSSDTKIPLVVVPHGGPWSRDYWALDQIVQYFATKGYAVLRVNFRGSTGLGKKHVISGLEGINSVMINDIADGTKHILEKFSIDSSKVFIYGHSYGGYASYMSLLRYPEIYHSGVAVSAPSNIKAWMKTQKKENNDFAYEFWDTALGNKNAKYLSEISPIYHVDKFDRPLLVLHGRKDEIIPVEQAETMVDKLKASNKKVICKIFKNESHSFDDSHSMGYVLDLADEFFRTETIDSAENEEQGK